MLNSSFFWNGNRGLHYRITESVRYSDSCGILNWDVCCARELCYLLHYSFRSSDWLDIMASGVRFWMSCSRSILIFPFSFIIFVPLGNSLFISTPSNREKGRDLKLLHFPAFTFSSPYPQDDYILLIYTQFHANLAKKTKTNSLGLIPGKRHVSNFSEKRACLVFLLHLDNLPSTLTFDCWETGDNYSSV